MGAREQVHLENILPAVLGGLADEAEGVRSAALAAGRTLVDLYSLSALELLLPAILQGTAHRNWRIRQSSIELLGALLFKVRPPLADAFVNDVLIQHFLHCLVNCSQHVAFARSSLERRPEEPNPHGKSCSTRTRSVQESRWQHDMLVAFEHTRPL